MNKLDLSHNQISALSEDFPFFPKLKLLKMDANQIEDIPEDFFDKLSVLESISLNSNKLIQIVHSTPESLVNLHNVSITENVLGPNFPTLFCGLPQLQSLNLSKNRL